MDNITEMKTQNKEITKEKKKKKKKKPKCSFCKKKILMEYKCKCDKIFCLKHRNPNKHECKFNFVEFYKKNSDIAVNGNAQFSKIDKLN